MKYIVCYDIANPKRLNKVAKELNSRGYRLQKSFFSCDLTDSEYIDLVNFILEIIDMKTDRIAVYRICEKCISGGVYIGCNASEFFDKEYLIL